MGVIVLRVLDADDWEAWRLLRRAALEDAPAAFGSTLAEWSGAGDTEERWRRRLDGVARNVLAELDGRRAGMVSATSAVEGDVQLLSMWVAAGARGKGVGDALVEHVKQWAIESGADRVVLDVRTTNTHAISLYARHGFLDAGEVPSTEALEPERRMVAALSDRTL